MDRTFMKMVHIFSLFVTGYSQSTCRPPGPDGIPYCCPFYFLKQNVCVECPAGYNKSPSGNNCSVPCRHPSYGARCGSRCNCSEEDCHHVDGCPVTSTKGTFQKNSAIHYLSTSFYTGK
nr:uncharacterized protein LOC117693004 [Crassostrea gigas]